MCKYFSIGQLCEFKAVLYQPGQWLAHPVPDEEINGCPDGYAGLPPDNKNRR
jgi:hypothetical protein